jgi:hypothetical protein
VCGGIGQQQDFLDFQRYLLSKESQADCRIEVFDGKLMLAEVFVNTHFRL